MPSEETSDTLAWSLPVTAVLTAVVSVVATIYAMRTTTAPPGVKLPSALGSLVKDTLTYIPHILLLFGVLADMFTYQGVYSIASLVGLLSIPLNWVMSYFWSGVSEVISKVYEVIQWRRSGAPMMASNPRANLPTVVRGGAVGDYFRDYDGCTVQGFGWAQSKYAPQTLVVTATVFSYYMFDLIVNKGWASAAGTISLFLVLFIAETMVIGRCVVANDDEPGMIAKAIASFTEGLLFGGIAYATVQSVEPTRLPSSLISSIPRRTRADLKPGPNGTMVDASGKPYIVLPNGEAVPDMCTNESKTAFAGTFGSGAPAMPANCPAPATR